MAVRYFFPDLGSWAKPTSPGAPAMTPAAREEWRNERRVRGMVGSVRG
jgi:hypothetical protein